MYHYRIFTVSISSILLGVPLEGQPVGLVLHPLDQLPLEPGVAHWLTHPPLKICNQSA